MRLTAAAMLTALATQSTAGGLDVSGQPISFIFNPGTVIEFGYGRISPSISGNDAAIFGGGATGNIAKDIDAPFFSFKHDFNEKLSFGVIYEQPFGADVAYGPTSFAFAGTTASAETSSVTAILRYKINERWSVYGGPRWQRAEANFLLTGGIYGPFSGYSATLAQDDGLGYVIGAAFEIPEYFIRAALTYNSAISHTFMTTEVSGPIVLTTPVSASMPQSLNFEFTAGVAPKTFVFGGARWVEWSKLQFAPPILAAASPDPLVDFNNTATYSLGVGRQITESWTGLFSVIYEPSTGSLTTPLTPTDGFYGASLGAVYSKNGYQIQANVTAMQLGNTTPFVSALGTVVSSFSSNTSVGVGVKVSKSF
jgi:long-chain fatty acid transport protein